MALPEEYLDEKEYFRELVDFLYEFRWLHVHPNTDIFTCNVLECIPKEWSDYFDSLMTQDSLKMLGLGLEISDAPTSLNAFIKRSNSLTPRYTFKNETIQLENIKGLSVKKQHEISLLASLIYNFCQESCIDYVVDVGCGLGYLTNLLHEKGIRIMGIDCNLKFVQTAKEKYPVVPFKHLFVTNESSKMVTKLLSKNFLEFDENVHTVCLVALHACADLTVDMLKLSLGMECLKMGVVMPCCYHRMKIIDNLNDTGIEHHQINKQYVNFPLSGILIEILNDKYDVFLGGSFLRLACQRANWTQQPPEETETVARNLLFRNLLQLVAKQENYSLQRRHRKTGSSRDNYTIDNFVSTLSSSYNITSNSSSISAEALSHLILKLRQQFDKYAARNYTLAAFVALQTLVQPISENLVLLDRCVYVQQAAGVQCKTLKVTDPCISPRCFALVITKQNSNINDPSVCRQCAPGAPCSICYKRSKFN